MTSLQNKISLSLLLLLIGSLGNCAAVKNYVKNDEVIDKKIPLMVLEDVTGNKYSTGKLRTQEKTILFIFDELSQLEQFKEPKNEYWQIFDARNRKWYHLSFLYRMKFKKYPKLMIDESNGLLDSLSLERQARVLNVEMGEIKKIISYDDYLSLKAKSENN